MKLPLWVHCQNFSQPKSGYCQVLFPQAFRSPWQLVGTVPGSLHWAVLCGELKEFTSAGMGCSLPAGLGGTLYLLL